MKHLFIINLFFLLSLGLLSCDLEDDTPKPSNNNNNGKPSASGWLVPQSEVFDGGPGKDGIPALSDPQFTAPQAASYLNDDDLVLGFVKNGLARAYPHNILDWHEIVNDSYDDLHLAVIYCPLTGTGIGWNREIGGKVTTFGVSGLLYNSNIIPYDRESDSNWSQMLLKSVNGSLKGKEAETINLIETSWETWKSMYPETQVLSEQTGFSRNYTRYPYGSYKTSDQLIFPVNNHDSRLPRKERVLGILVKEKTKAYSINNFGTNISLIHDKFNGHDLIIAGSKDKNFIVAYKSDVGDGNKLQFSTVQNSLPVIMKDQAGTSYDISGKAVDGPGKGEQLVPVTQFIGYWFAWAAFYPDIALY